MVLVLGRILCELLQIVLSIVIDFNQFHYIVWGCVWQNIQSFLKENVVKPVTEKFRLFSNLNEWWYFCQIFENHIVEYVVLKSFHQWWKSHIFFNHKFLNHQWDSRTTLYRLTLQYSWPCLDCLLLYWVYIIRLSVKQNLYGFLLPFLRTHDIIFAS